MMYIPSALMDDVIIRVDALLKKKDHFVEN